MLFRSARLSEAFNLVASAVAFCCALPLPFLVGDHASLFWGDYIIVDRTTAWVVMCTAIVYFLASVYAVGYMRLLNEEPGSSGSMRFSPASGLTTLAGPLMNSVGIYWIAIELTTLVSTFLVAFEREAESMEAAWKYIMVVSAGISLALLGTVLFYWGGTFVLGPTYNMTWSTLAAAAPQINPVLLTLAFLLVLVGYGTKVGFAPMHAWLPDAHSEGPAPVSVMLSGALLNTAMVGIFRFLGDCRGRRRRRVVRSFLSLSSGPFRCSSALCLSSASEGVKRLMAYSSIEHMGVVALGFGFGGPLGVAGAFYHMLNHSLNKSLMFFGAGNMMRAYGAKRIGRIREVAQFFPHDRRAVARRSGRHYRRAAVRAVHERIHDHAGRASTELLLGRLPHGGAPDRHFRWLHEPFSRHVLWSAGGFAAHPDSKAPGASRRCGWR